MSREQQQQEEEEEEDRESLSDRCPLKGIGEKKPGVRELGRVLGGR